MEWHHSKPRESSKELTDFGDFSKQKMQPAYLYYSTDQFAEAAIIYESDDSDGCNSIENLIQFWHVSPIVFHTRLNILFHVIDFCYTSYHSSSKHMLNVFIISYRSVTCVSVWLHTRGDFWHHLIQIFYTCYYSSGSHRTVETIKI